MKDLFPRRAHPARQARRVVGATGGALYVALTASIGVSAYLDQPDAGDQEGDDTQGQAVDALGPSALALDLNGGATSTSGPVNLEDPAVWSGEVASTAADVETSTTASTVPVAPTTVAPTSSDTSVAVTQPSTQPPTTSQQPTTEPSTELSTTQPPTELSTTQPPTTVQSSTTEPPTTPPPTTEPPTTQPPTTPPPTTGSTTTVVTGAS